MSGPRKLAAGCALAVAMLACRGGSSSTTGATGPTGPAAGTPTRQASANPKLVVLLVLDQWPAWAFENKRAALLAERGGFARLLAEGEWHTGEHPSIATLTAPGHAVLGTGRPPSESGILANAWYHRDTNKRMHATEGSDGTPSAEWLRVSGLGDAFTARGGKAVGISLKDRASILLLGHAGTPIWIDKKALAFATTGTPPAWLQTLNGSRPIEPKLSTVWTPSVSPARLAELSGTIDAQPGEFGQKYGFGTTFPYDPKKATDPTDAMMGTPVANTLLVDVALAALAGEQLGADATPDLLAVSFSAHDYIGHGWGHESWEMWDMTLRLDREIARLLTALDDKVGAGQWAMAVTSDHGASPLPETMNGGRISYDQILDATRRAANAELGSGEWILDTKYPTVFIAPQIFAIKNERDRNTAIKKIMFSLRAFPGIARVERAADFVGNCEARPPDARAICRALDPERSGDIVYLPKPGWVLHESDDPVGTGHGSPHDYDRLVPLILLPPGRSAHAPDAAARGRVDLMTLADTLAGYGKAPAPRTLPR